MEVVDELDPILGGNFIKLDLSRKSIEPREAPNPQLLLPFLLHSGWSST